MTKFMLLLTSAIALSTATTLAQGLVPSMEKQFDFCVDRPMEPEWMGNLPSREKYKRLVIQTIYRAQSVERIVQSGECSCKTRFPDWDASVQQFNDRYLGTDRSRLREANSLYLARFNELRNVAKSICETVGHW